MFPPHYIDVARFFPSGGSLRGTFCQTRPPSRLFAKVRLRNRGEAVAHLLTNAVVQKSLKKGNPNRLKSRIFLKYWEITTFDLIRGLLQTSLFNWGLNGYWGSQSSGCSLRGCRTSGVSWAHKRLMFAHQTQVVLCQLLCIHMYIYINIDI